MPASPGPDRLEVDGPGSSPAPRARDVILRRRSAVAFDPRVGLRLETFLADAAAPASGAPPWDAIAWPPAVHLILFVHRVEGSTPGIYAFLRDPAAEPELRAAMRSEFLWEPPPPFGFGGRPVQDCSCCLPT